MPDVFSRLSATSKGVTLGAALLLGSAAVHTHEPGVTARAVAGIAFLLLTSPIAGHVLGRAAWRAGEPASVTHRDDFPTGPGAHGAAHAPTEADSEDAEDPLVRDDPRLERLAEPGEPAQPGLPGEEDQR